MKYPCLRFYLKLFVTLHVSYLHGIFDRLITELSMVGLNVIGDLSLENTRTNLYIFIFFVALFNFILIQEIRLCIRDCILSEKETVLEDHKPKTPTA